MVGLGRMGANLTLRLLRDGHEVVATDLNAAAVSDATAEGATGARSVEELVALLEPPRVVWSMVPAGDPTDAVVAEVGERFAPGDTLIDGGNTHYVDDLRRAQELGGLGIGYVDVGVSGGVWGLERGFCLMIGGEADDVARLDPIFRSLAPGVGTATRTHEEREPTPAEHGYLHCGPAGAGHFVKMVHNGIEYALMAAYAEGLNILANADVGLHAEGTGPSSVPLAHADRYRYRFDVAEIAEVWRRGSVVSSWLLDLTAAALADDAELSSFQGRVADSGEGRWTAIAAIEEGVPADVIIAALSARFTSQGRAEFAGKLLSAMRHRFGGHAEKLH